PHAPWIGTGMEHQTARDSGAALLAKHAGVVEYVDGNEIRVRRTSGELDIYNITKYRRSNSGTSYNQRPLARLGEKVEKNDIIADGPSMENGEMALGQNPLVAYMTWEGYNFEDAVIMSERLIKDDVYTSIAIEEYESETR
ncbi:DNA-directed RNA polymerase subunit beta, partial [Citrobacter sp. TBCS-11]